MQVTFFSSPRKPIDDVKPALKLFLVKKKKKSFTFLLLSGNPNNQFISI